MAISLSIFSGLLFLTLLTWEISNSPTNAETQPPKPTPTPAPGSPEEQAQRQDKFIDYLSRGIDIATASLDDIERDSKGWKLPIWKKIKSEQAYYDETLKRHYKYPLFVGIRPREESEKILLTSTIYYNITDLLPLLKPAPNSLRHDIERFEERFRETTLPSERVINGFATARIQEIAATNLRWKEYLDEAFSTSVKGLLAKPETFSIGAKSQPYYDFMKKYGTHYVTEADFGGIYMVDIKIAMDNAAIGKDMDKLEMDIGQALLAELKHFGTVPEDAKTLKYNQIFYFGGNSSSHGDSFYNQLKWNRTISRVRLEPISALINLYHFPCPDNDEAKCTDYKKSLPIVVAGLQEMEKVQEFQYELNRWKAVFDVAKVSPFHDTATGYHDSDHFRSYLNEFLNMKPFPNVHAHHDVYQKYLREMFQWPLDYQIGLRGSLGA